MLERFVLSAALLIPTSAGIVPAQTSGQVARSHMAALSGEIGGRLAGSPEESSAADYIEEVFDRLGYETTRQGFAFRPEDRERGDGLISANVMALKAGESDLQIVVGAHYDSEVNGRGAGDNASGVGVMLEVAAALRDVTTPYTIRFVAFGAEEQELSGSRHFVQQMSADEIRSTVAMVNLDSLVVGEIAYVYGSAGDRGVIRDWILRRASEVGMDLRTQAGENPEYPAGTTCDCSDHAAFDEAGIQYVYFESTNWSLGDKDGYVQVDPRYGEGGRVWHTRFDTLDYIDRTFPGRVDQRLGLFSAMLYRTLTEFAAP